MLFKQPKRYACEKNSGFKITFPNGFIVSIWFEDHDYTEVFDEKHELIEPVKETIFRFAQADLSILGTNGINYTNIFCSELAGYSKRMNIVYQVQPTEFADILYKVSSYNKGD